MDPIKVQAQIRANSEEVASFVSDLSKWEKDMTNRDKAVRQAKSKRGVRAPPRAGGGTVQVINAKPPSEKAASAANHTYDVGYKKWENFKEGDEDANANESANNKTSYQTPASIIQTGLPAAAPSLPVPRARGVASTVDAEAAERERGNDEFKSGNFNNAVKQYTKCLGMKVKNYIAFSNRAMAYLKLKEYIKAEADCTCAIDINPEHVKSLTRRATARNALGKHRSAIADLLAAEKIEPGSKAIKADLAKAREQLRNAVNRAPLVEIPVTSQEEGTESLQGPDMPSAGYNRVIIEEDESSGADATTGSSSPPNVSEERDHVIPEVKKAMTDRQINHQSESSAASVSSKVAKKKTTAKKSAAGKAKPVATGRGYDLERNLLLYKGQNRLMEQYLDSLSLSDVPMLMNNLMEGDVVATLLLELSELQGNKRGDWDVVLDWFQSISEVSSFGLLISLIRESDKAKLLAMLNRSVRVVSEDDTAVLQKVELLKAAYKL